MKLSCIVASALILSLCSCSSGGSGAQGSAGDGTLVLSVTDAPFDHSIVDEAVIDVDKIRIHADANAGSGFLTLYDGAPITFDLLDLTNGLTQELVQAQVPAASYRQIRLHVASAYLKLTNGNLYTTDDGSLKLTSQDTSGFKVFVDPPVVVQAGFSTELLLDFDLTKTFKGIPANDPENATSFKLMPVIRAANLSTSGEIRGLVTEDDGAGGQIPAPNATVYILPPGETDLGNSLANTSTGADGLYAVLGLPAGSYDVVATKAALQDRLDGVVVSVGSASVADLFVQ